MYNYRRNLLVFSILLLVLGAVRSVVFFQSIETWSLSFQFAGDQMGLLILYLVCDILTSIGAVISGILGIVLRKKEKGLIVWSILSFIVAAAFLVNIFVVIGNSSGEYSNYSSRRSLSFTAVVPILQGLCYIGVEKNWAEKAQKYQK